MRPVVRYAGREATGPSRWTVWFDLVDDDGVTRYWTEFPVDGLFSAIDVETPNFWGYVAYLGGRFIENRQLGPSTNEVLSPADEALDRARTAGSPMAEPNVGQVCWRFGLPPYDEDTSGDAFQM